jgi:Spy/CpxP family protein refolding chaperone
MPRKVFLVLLGLILFGASWAWGQPGHEFGGGGFQERLMEVKRNQLGPAVGVDQNTVNKLLAIDQRYKPMRHQLIMGMRTDLQRLQQLMSQPAPPEPEIKAILASMKQKRLEMLNLQQRKDEEETALLTPVQQARYIIYLMGLIREARSIKGGTGGPGGGMGAPSGGMGGPGGMGAPAFRPREIPVSRPPQ